ncbi:MAG: hypothetical protein AAFU57_06630 [Bacteroidota bacterium]
MENISYHGTSLTNATKIVGSPNNVDVTLGKGELGQGFYTGTSIALAAIWAQSRHEGNSAVIKFEISESDFIQLNGHLIKKRNKLKKIWNDLIERGTTVTHKFGYDYVVSPFATVQETGSQLKFESKKAEKTLNNSKATII